MLENIELSASQEALFHDVWQFMTAHNKEQCVIVLEGRAGTGKSVFLSHLFSQLQQASREDKTSVFYGRENALLVNHPEMLKAYKVASEQQTFLRKKDFERPTTFINRAHKLAQHWDTVIIDEAHLLLTQADRYNHFKEDNHLQEILKLARCVVLVFDELQVLKGKSLWTQKGLQALCAGRLVKKFALREQFRQYGSAAFSQWIADFSQGKLTPIPRPEERFAIRIFASAGEMYAAVRKANQQYGLSRMIATYDYPYKLDGKDYFIDEPDFHLRWDRHQPSAKLSWAQREDSLDEVGSVYTVQGFDLAIAGVILGPSVRWNEKTQAVEMLPVRYEDQTAFHGLAHYAEAEALKKQLMWNALQVLLTRARRGLYLFAHDKALAMKLQECCDA